MRQRREWKLHNQESQRRSCAFAVDGSVVGEFLPLQQVLTFLSRSPLSLSSLALLLSCGSLAEVASLLNILRIYIVYPYHAYRQQIYVLIKAQGWNYSCQTKIYVHTEKSGEKWRERESCESAGEFVASNERLWQNLKSLRQEGGVEGKIKSRERENTLPRLVTRLTLLPESVALMMRTV